MFTSIVFTAVLASSAALLSHAIVDPNEPGPGESFNEGATCHIGWAGDDSGTSAWQGMDIELMTGPNEAMIHVTTVATNQDGTKDGTFDYPCPAVTPNSPIYFYQFTAPGTSNFTWTGRFTIAGTDGSSTPATETEQSNGETVHWGTGALVDPSSATPPPSFNSTSSSGSNSAPGASASGVSASSVLASGSLLPSSAATTPSAKPSNVPSVSSGNGAASSSPPQSSGTSSAMRPAVIDMHVWPIVAALTASAMAAAILL